MSKRDRGDMTEGAAAVAPKGASCVSWHMIGGGPCRTLHRGAQVAGNHTRCAVVILTTLALFACERTQDGRATPGDNAPVLAPDPAARAAIGAAWREGAAAGREGRWDAAAVSWKKAARAAREGGLDAREIARLEAAAAAAATPKRTDGAGIELLLVAPGEFTMGSPEDEAGRDEDEALRTTSIERPFYLGRTEVTQAQWRAVMGTTPSRFTGDSRPVEQVAWAEATELVAKLSQREGATYRLPTEGEWEYVCRAGTATPFSTGHSLLASHANIRERGATPGAGLKSAWREETADVGSYDPNPWGFHDLHGNVWEWIGAPDPRAPLTGEPGDGPRQVLRGGGWNFGSEAARCAARMTLSQERRYDCNGLRVVREVGP